MTICSNSTKEVGHHLVTAIAAQGINLYEMRRVRPTLEDVFLDLITSEATPDSRDPDSPETVETVPEESASPTDDATDIPDQSPE